MTDLDWQDERAALLQAAEQRLRATQRRRNDERWACTDDPESWRERTPAAAPPTRYGLPVGYVTLQQVLAEADAVRRLLAAWAALKQQQREVSG
jgi:GAF domain-containing protein